MIKNRANVACGMFFANGTSGEGEEEETYARGTGNRAESRSISSTRGFSLHSRLPRERTRKLYRRLYRLWKHRELKVSTVANLSRCLPECLCSGRLWVPWHLCDLQKTRHIINNSRDEFGICHNFTKLEITYYMKHKIVM